MSDTRLSELNIPGTSDLLRKSFGDIMEKQNVPSLFGDAGVQAIMRKKRQSLEGFDSQEMQRMRDTATRGSQAQEQAGMRRLVAQQRRMGIKGGVAQQGLVGLQTEAQRARQDSENKIMQLQRQEQQTALNEYGKMFQGASEFDIKNKLKSAMALTSGGVGLSSVLGGKKA